MLTLGIETSCDETSCAVLDGKDRILSNVVSSSLARHRPFGGVVPEIASRHCLEQIGAVYREALRRSSVRPSDLELIAVTQGPGLIGSLLVGVCFAKALSYGLRVPLAAVNHLEAHLAACFIGEKVPETFVGLLVSGGHTSLSYHRGRRIRMLGSTVDDAAGEAFDKVAKLMGLGYPGGPVIEKTALRGDRKAFRFTKPKQDNRFDFSFSGIKTAVLYEVQKHRFGLRGGKVSGTRTEKIDLHGAAAAAPLPERFVCDMAASFQSAVVDWLVEKTLAAAEFKRVSDVAVGGGVSANQALRHALGRSAQAKGVRVLFPQRPLALDNAAMIARRGIELCMAGRKKASLRLAALPNLKMA
ncbi:MAG: tRNA (adenosine(37)-N6)-threonylcarbamoyltransferase complex transferase subunit TsaD [Candidatus Omnitrophota bacterium]|jgi:N6-L-threonylcarbamoyladenine synthase